MPLEELNEKLHKREYEPGEVHEPLSFTPETPKKDAAVPHAPKENNTEWTADTFPTLAVEEKPPTEADFKRAQKRKWAIIAGVSALIVLAGGIFFKMHTMAFTTEKVVVTLSGPQTIDSNKDVLYTIGYANNNWTDLENATLVFSYPESFKPTFSGNWKANGTKEASLALGTLPAGKKGVIEVQGAFRSIQNEGVVLQAALRFSPKGGQTDYEVKTDTSVSVGSTLIQVNMEAPSTVADGQKIIYTVTYKNGGEETVANSYLEMEFPDGFHFTTSDPAPSQNENRWSLGDLTSGKTGSIKIEGRINGVKDDVKKSVARLGKIGGDNSFITYGEIEKVSRIISTPLSISQIVNGETNPLVRPGVEMHYSIPFKNQGDIGLRNLVLTVDLDLTYLDLKTLKLNQGTYNAATQQIIIRASDFPVLSGLEPGQGGVAEFMISTKKSILGAESGKKNLSFQTIARIDSPDVPTPIGANKVIASNTITVKIPTFVDLAWTGFYNDSVMPNTGPIPPQVGKATTYTLHVKTSSTLDDITNARVIAFLPSNVRYLGTRQGEKEVASFNERTGQLTWEIGTLSAGTQGARELAFQVSITPDESLLDKEVILLNNSTFSGKDNFTGRDIEINTQNKTTNLPEDTNLPSQGGRVVPAS